MNTYVMRGKHRAFVFVDVVTGKEREVLENLLKYNEVVEADLIPSQYDIIAFLEFDLYGQAIFFSAQETISKFVVNKIRKLRDVQETNTLHPSFSLTKRAK